MRWKKSRRSSNIEDRRSAGFRSSGKGKKIGIVSIIFALAALFFGKDIGPLLGIVTSSFLGGGGNQYEQSASTAQNDEMTQFVSSVLAQTEDVWGQIFNRSDNQYQQPNLVLYSDATATACGTGSAASGPFYCLGDNKVYLDLSFLNQLQQMGVNGDFAVAYVIAHEIGHHVQNQLGISMAVQAQQRQLPEVQANQLSVKVELQADCFAGIWTHYAEKNNQILEQGDIQEAMNAAAKVGDDYIQRSAGQRVNPDAFTHGTSKQRMQWFQQGLQSGDIQSCNTFI